MRNWFIVLGLGLFTATPMGAETPPKPDRLTPLSIEAALDPDAWGRRPGQRSWSPDGRRLLYLWDEKGDRKEALWTLDPETGRHEVLVRLADLKQGEEEDFDLAEHDWSPKGDALLLVSEGDLYLYLLNLPENSPGTSKKLRRLTRTGPEEESPTFSPDGSRLAFVRDFDLHVLDLATGPETRLTTDGKENAFLNGTTDWVYWEEIWDRDAEGYWWSPDGSRIAYYRFDERAGPRPAPGRRQLPSPDGHVAEVPQAGRAQPEGAGRRHRRHRRRPDGLDWRPGDPDDLSRPRGLDPGRGRRGHPAPEPRPDPARPPALRRRRRRLLHPAHRDLAHLGQPRQRLPLPARRPLPLGLGARRLAPALPLTARDGKLVRPVTPEGWAIAVAGRRGRRTAAG